MTSSIPRFSDYRKIVFFTGAGLSAESGIPTYRGKGGLWAEYDYEEYACQRAFDRDPDKVWDFHDKRRAAVAECRPNIGHQVIAEVQESQPGTIVITQNIDGFHVRAGATDVIELHGCLWRVRCERGDTLREDFTVPIASRKCACGGNLRPDIVWFEDALDPKNLRQAREALDGCDLLVSVGTSGVVFPAADLPRIAMANGATSVEINLEDTPVSAYYTHRLRGKATELLASMHR